jgi:hypothetical protein
MEATFFGAQSEESHRQPLTEMTELLKNDNYFLNFPIFVLMPENF